MTASKFTELLDTTTYSVHNVSLEDILAETERRRRSSSSVSSTASAMVAVAVADADAATATTTTIADPRSSPTSSTSSDGIKDPGALRSTSPTSSSAAATASKRISGLRRWDWLGGGGKGR